MIILGIDPGSRITGFGVIDNQASRIAYIASGSIKVIGDSLPQRLGYIFSAIDEVIREHQPMHMSIENVFMSRNADSALKLGQARGAAICAGHQAGHERRAALRRHLNVGRFQVAVDDPDLVGGDQSLADLSGKIQSFVESAGLPFPTARAGSAPPGTPAP